MFFSSSVLCPVYQNWIKSNCRGLLHNSKGKIKLRYEREGNGYVQSWCRGNTGMQIPNDPCTLCLILLLLVFVVFYRCLLYNGLQIGCPCRGLRLPRADTLNLAIWVPGIKLAKCPIIQGFAFSLFGTHLLYLSTNHICLLGLLLAAVPVKLFKLHKTYYLHPFKKIKS